MGKEITTFVNTEIENQKFHHYKYPYFLNDVDNHSISISNKTSSGANNYKHFIWYLHGDQKVKLLHIILLKTSSYIKSYCGETIWMYFSIEDDELLKNVMIVGMKLAI